MNRTPSRRVRTVRPLVETLEDRNLLTCTATLTGSILTIRGSTGVDNVRIGDDGTGNITVVCDQELTVRLFQNVTEVRVNLLAGRDSVVYDLLNNANTSRTVNIDLGAGKDKCQVFLNNSDFFGTAAYAFSIDGRGGRDRFDMTTADDIDTARAQLLSQGLNLGFFSGFSFGFVGPLSLQQTLGSDVTQQASLQFTFQGQAGADTANVNYFGNVSGLLSISALDITGLGATRDSIDITYQGLLQGTLNVRATGGDRPDTIRVDLTLTAGSNGNVDARVKGGDGDDDLTLNIRLPGPGPTILGLGQTVVTAFGQIDGGAGTDTCSTIGPVAVINCP